MIISARTEPNVSLPVSEFLEIVFTRTWWTLSSENNDWFSTVYHWGNILEGCAWFVFAVLVIQRFRMHRQSRVEVIYAFAFATFALTDFREAWAQSSWLIWLKLANLVALFCLRRFVMSRYYPLAKVY